MLIFLRHGLAFLATPKTGTTATEHALRPHAEIVFARNRKHLTAQRFRLRVAPFVREAFGARCAAVAVMRDPVDQMRSWYRYRQSPKLEGTKVSTQGMSFDDFALAVIHEDPPAAAQIGSQFAFLTGAKGDLLVQHLFAYETMGQLQGFFAERFGEGVRFKAINVSEQVDAALSPEVDAQLRSARAAEFALHERLIAAGGYLETPQPGS